MAIGVFSTLRFVSEEIDPGVNDVNDVELNRFWAAAIVAPPSFSPFTKGIISNSIVLYHLVLVNSLLMKKIIFFYFLMDF